MVECRMCHEAVGTNEFLLIPLCIKPRVIYMCHECIRKALNDYFSIVLSDGVGNSSDDKGDGSKSIVPTVPLNQLREDIKVHDVFSIVDEILCELINKYNLTYIEIFDVLTRLQIKVYTYYVRDMNRPFTEMLMTALNSGALLPPQLAQLQQQQQQEQRQGQGQEQPYQKHNYGECATGECTGVGCNCSKHQSQKKKEKGKEKEKEGGEGEEEERYDLPYM